MKILNLFSSIGGNRYLLDNDKLSITAVEHNPEVAEVYQELFPDDEVIVTDAWEFVKNNSHNYDIIWASPPCQSHSKWRRVHFARTKKGVFPDFRMYGLIVFLDKFFKGNWVVENVKPYYEPLFDPVAIGRHLFWSNIPLKTDIVLPKPAWGGISNNKKVIGDSYITMMEKYLGFSLPRKIAVCTDYDKRKRTGTVYRNCVHPLLGKYVLDQLLY